jgi:acylphosphatase
MKSVHVLISGFVQGVGYRRFVKRSAKRLLVKGWVKNNTDGTVEALFQSQSEKDLVSLITICKKDSFFAHIKEMKIDWDMKIDRVYDDFLILK